SPPTETPRAGKRTDSPMKLGQRQPLTALARGQPNQGELTMPSVHRPHPSVNVRINVQGKNARANIKVTVHTPKKRRPRKLKFGQGNAKLDKAIFTFSLPAGHSCPFAHACRSRAERESGKIVDGPATAFRCYAASMEARLTTVRDARWHNFQLLRACKTEHEMASLILDSLTPFAGYVRVHDSGDFFSQQYFD